MKNLIVLLLSLNAISHVFSYKELNEIEDSSADGVLAFAFINAIVAILFVLDYAWSKWLVLAFPAIGVTALFMTTLVQGKGKLVDYIIFVLDITIIGLILTYSA